MLLVYILSVILYFALLLNSDSNSFAALDCLSMIGSFVNAIDVCGDA